ncbi:scarecrow-like protein 14 [Salvia hispanica]|uniref:scarecrow-like protein 14 n=1 Tax=Salvia hispanica TaxID=49212 RepID=UPI002009466F|nr:scarecrow-like protein 14 [Salvia hispanica]
MDHDHSDAILKLIGIMLMEEDDDDLENKPCMLHDCLALQATEKSLYDLLNNNSDNDLDSSSDNITDKQKQKKNRYREDDYRSNKQLASNLGGEDEALEMFDKVLLCSHSDCTMPKANTKKPGGRRGGGGAKKQLVVVDLHTLLMQCAQAVATFDTATVTDLLAKIRRHSSPHGDGTQRLAHYFANALEARVAGTASAAYTAFSNRISAAVFVRGYHTFIKACPFRKMSNVLANKTIRKLADSAAALHIIDFGILYGFQWPCLIQSLSERPGGPPKLRITGIDFPQSGFRPAERVSDTGDRLARYCQRFGVPFEYKAIAQKWESIKLEELEIERGELLVVNCLHRLPNVPDETVVVDSPRDQVLKLIKRIDPDMFIQGVVNGTYNTPFFVTRFREVLFQYSSLFDMYEATVPREDPNRLLFEEEVFGKDAINIIACEGTERLDRPETYKQWQARIVRAGFRQLPLDQQIVSIVKNKVKAEYHKDFSVDEDGKWMLQGWKGRVLHAFSCWKPAQN